MKRFLLFMVFLSFAGFSRGATAAEPTRFLRYIELPDGSARLEAAEAAYKNGDGVVVHLIAAVHIADVEFFAGLDESFDHYDALLYEMVTQHEPATQPAGKQSRRLAMKRLSATAPSSMVWISATQMMLRDKLKLAFQLDEINYDKPSFVHADMDMQTFLNLQSARGESMLGLMVRSTIQNMAKSLNKGPDTSGLLLLGAMFSRDQANELKRAFAIQFADLDDAMDAIEGPNGSVIIDERNKVALRVLDKQIALGKKYLGIFYGAGHLSRMEASLEAKGFHKVGVTWRTAWSIAPSTTLLPATKPAKHAG